jgi:adenosylcobinamide-GDP ribazoletransferase
MVLGPGALLAALAVLVVTATVGLLAVRKIGGMVGDVLGAAEQIGETAVLLTTAALALHTGHFPWWSS